MKKNENSDKNSSIAWAKEYLLANSYQIKDLAERVVTTPWSSVTRFSTSKGYFYLKQTTPALFLEPAIIDTLHKECDANVPLIIGVNNAQCSFLMKDAGNPLRTWLKGTFEVKVFCRAIKKYTEIQKAAVSCVDGLLKLGVPDWRLAKLPALYQQFISQEKLLIEDGLTNIELDQLHERISKFKSMCAELSHYHIPETLDHCDFHDNNILLETNNTNRMTIIDWGESVITHPFFSLATCLSTAVRQYDLQENDSDPIYMKLYEAAFDNWVECELTINVHEAFILAKKLWFVYVALAHYRLKLSSDPASFEAYPRRKGRMADPLKQFIHASTHGTAT